MRHIGFFAICGAAILLVLSAPAVAKDEGRGIGYAATGPFFDLPAGISLERLEMDVSLYSVRLNYVFKSVRRQTVHVELAAVSGGRPTRGITNLNSRAQAHFHKPEMLG